jgi:hypothetical protein
MLLVAYLRMRHDAGLSSADRRLLAPMICRTLRGVAARLLRG